MIGKYWLLRKAPRAGQIVIQNLHPAAHHQVIVNRRKFISSWLIKLRTINIEFTREDLVTALNDMVKEYRKLSHLFEEAKAENMSPKSSLIESSSDELEDIDSLKTELIYRSDLIGDRICDEVTVIGMNRMFIRWTRARWAGPSLSLVYLIRLKGFITNNHNNYIAQNPNPRALKAAAAAPRRNLFRPTFRGESIGDKIHQSSNADCYECCRRDQSPVVTFVLPDQATTAGYLPTGPPPDPGGSNVTDLASNRDLTREIWSLQVNAPAILHRHDHLLFFAFVLPAPATTARALPSGPSPGPGGSNENQPHPQPSLHEGERTLRHMHKHTLRDVRHQAIGSTTITPLRTTTSHS
ncbi:hypothetical protein F511_27993 [Dorcoceras hygrometricum]|uniref:Uncharacterized protein n=1 Tax=Dorcoceras hygrometricum TaxID=472368 RepID=A0A2Z7AKQ0_9LAMI|nr:hypothetical protein F511_27993 [Dorcoceras hygrometricum]